VQENAIDGQQRVIARHDEMLPPDLLEQRRRRRLIRCQPVFAMRLMHVRSAPWACHDPMPGRDPIARRLRTIGRWLAMTEPAAISRSTPRPARDPLPASS